MNEKRIAKYTLAIFLDRAIDVHGAKYDYSQITEHHINGVKSKIPVRCNVCQYDWSPSISDHIYHKRGCPVCAVNVL